MKRRTFVSTYYLLSSVHAFCLSCLISSSQPGYAVCLTIIFILLMSKLRGQRSLEVKRGHSSGRQAEDVSPGPWWPQLTALPTKWQGFWVQGPFGLQPSLSEQEFDLTVNLVFCGRGWATWPVANRNGHLNTNWKRDLLLQWSENRWR